MMHLLLKSQKYEISFVMQKWIEYYSQINIYITVLLSLAEDKEGN